jgi:hypothetical protein
MATYINTKLYPPIIGSNGGFMPAFVDKPKVAFSVSPYMSVSDVKAVHLTCITLKGGSNVVNSPSFVWSFSLSDEEGGCTYNKETGLYTIDMTKCLREGLSNNTFYKVQLRFDSTPETQETHSLQTGALSRSYINANLGNFSEWSTVAILKKVPNPVFCLSGETINDRKGTSKTSSLNYSKGTFSLEGTVDWQEKDTAIQAESLYSYQVKIRDVDTDTLLSSSDTYYTRDSKSANSVNYQVSTEGYKNSITSHTFSATFNFVSSNGYEWSDTRYFTLSSYTTSRSNYKPSIGASEILDQGGIEITVINDVETNQTVSGFLRIKRSCSDSNYEVWETLYCKIVDNWEAGDNGALKFEDFTVCAGCWYKYSVQLDMYLNDILYSTKAVKTENPVGLPDFHDAIIYRQGRHVPLRYNFKVSTLKPTVNRTKVDTLGGKYPKFVENGSINYKVLSVTGTISSQMDDAKYFMPDDMSTKTALYNRKYLEGLTIDDSTIQDISYEERVKKEEAEFSHYWSLTRKGAFASEDSTDKRCYNIEKSESYDTADSEDQYDLSLAEDFRRAVKDGIVVKQGWHSQRRGGPSSSYNFLMERQFREELTAWLNDGEPKLFKSLTEGNLCVMFMDVSLTPNSTLGRRICDFSATMYQVEEGKSLATLSSLGIHCTGEEEALNALKANAATYSGNSVVKRKRLLQYYDDSPYERKNTTDKFLSLQDIAENVLEKEQEGYRQNNTYQSLGISEVKVTFSNPPHGFDAGLNIDKSGENVVFAGHKFEHDKASIFVGLDGYYQIPSIVELKPETLTFPDCNNTDDDNQDKVTIDYVIDYTEIIPPNTGESTLTGSGFGNMYTNIETVIGQVEGPFEYEQSFADSIFDKYTMQLDSDSYRTMESWSGLEIVADPYSVFEITSAEDGETQEIMIGESGVYRMMDNLAYKDIVFKGKRMFSAGKYPSSSKRSRSRFIPNPGENMYYESEKIYPGCLVKNTYYSLSGEAISTSGDIDNSDSVLLHCSVNGYFLYKGTVIQST